MYMKQCTRCKTLKDPDQFGKNNRARDGLNTRCKPCMREVWNEMYHSNPKRKADIRENNRRYVEKLRQRKADYLSDKTCADCGNSDPRVFEFDHTDDDKEFNVGDGISKGIAWAKIQEEIDKCDVVCANCHRIRTWIRRNGV